MEQMQGMASPTIASRQWETDPLLQRNNDYMVDGAKKERRIEGPKVDLGINSWTVFFLFLKLTLTPIIIFMFVSIIFMLCYHLIPITLIVIDSILVVTLLYVSFRMYWSYFGVEAFTYLVLAFALFSGATTGTHVSLSMLPDYWPYNHKRHYTNVAPDEPAGAHSDAAALVFMDGTKPDGSRSIAYERWGTKWCVAPISVDASSSTDLSISTDVQYWAVGKDCCTGHQGFTCGASQNPKAHSGLVMTGLNEMDSKIGSLLSASGMIYYDEAVLMATAKYDLTTPDDHMFVHFVADIEEARWAYYVAAWVYWWHIQSLMAIVWAFCGVYAIVMGEKTYRKHIKALQSDAFHVLNHNF